MSTLEAEAVTVAYPGNVALDKVSLSFQSARVHVLVGQNGAGKSSLIRVLSGALQPNGGAVKLDGKIVHLRRPADAAKLGVSLVPQELQLFPRLRVWENVTAPLADRRFVMESRGRLQARAREALALVGGTVEPGALVAELSPAQRQLVAIARSIVDRSRFLILDEPTAALASNERVILLDVLRNVASNGAGVLFVSHYLEESLAIGDEISVLRDARLVWTRPRAAVDEVTLTSAMFGEVVERRRLGSRTTKRSEPDARPLLALRDFGWPGVRRSIELDLFSSEIIGVAGLPGSGANTFNSAILGVLARRGDVVVDGHRLTRGIRDAFGSGLGYIPAERKAQALFTEMSVLDNLCAAGLDRFSARGVLKGRDMLLAARHLVRELEIVPPDPRVPVARLSGGNQQRVVVGRWFGAHIEVLLADEPTRGVDVAARMQIHLLLQRFAARGGACLVYSSDLDELVDISSSILLFHRDRPARLIDVQAAAHDLYEQIS